MTPSLQLAAVASAVPRLERLCHIQEAAAIFGMMSPKRSIDIVSNSSLFTRPHRRSCSSSSQMCIRRLYIMQYVRESEKLKYIQGLKKSGPEQWQLSLVRKVQAPPGQLTFRHFSNKQFPCKQLYEHGFLNKFKDSAIFMQYKMDRRYKSRDIPRHYKNFKRNSKNREMGYKTKNKK